MGSITGAAEFTFQSTPAYKISKAALNMMTAQYALALAGEGFIVFSIDPGVSLLLSDRIFLLHGAWRI